MALNTFNLQVLSIALQLKMAVVLLASVLLLLEVKSVFLWLGSVRRCGGHLYSRIHWGFFPPLVL